MKLILLSTIRLYQHTPLLVNGSCRFSPTCSEYCYQALDAHGTIKGSVLCIRRILKCNPLFWGTYDPTSNKS